MFPLTEWCAGGVYKRDAVVLDDLRKALGPSLESTYGLRRSPPAAAPGPPLNRDFWGAWVALSVERLTSAQVMISQSMSSSPTSGSVLTAQSLEPALDSVSPSLSLLFPCSCSVSLLQKSINI